ncbi:PREDICTED: alpha-tocopherol transfer protein-like [Nicrophorus vespilloides]|uniref:Alpha-tocopherol transfer protein-like n=1 Tax=Nicrophorus vespilloides TaxID=110193 RepID=A0ABM1MJB0_NICVS|nr:PREDICTED: alpha-tocopherol transfer protein-like [Nicrophorus vespilloides]
MSIRSVSQELQAKAIKELNEDVSRIPEDLAYIKNWLKQTKHINARTDDQWLLSFLRGCKFSLERTKEKLEMYYTMKTICPEFYNNRDPFSPEIQKILKSGCYLPLPQTQSPDSPRIVLLRNGSFDPNEINIADLMKSNMLIQDIMINEDDNFIIAGGIMIQDMKGSTMAHMTAMTPSIVKKSMTVFQEACPTRPKAGHFINIPSFFDAMFNMMKPFLNEKMKKRMVVHSTDNLEELYKTVPKEILPKEYGGDGPTLQELTDYWKTKVESYKNWFKEDAKYKSDESKRPGKPKTSADYFGMEGSFRKLNID